MTTPAKPLNPYQAALGALAVVLVIIGVAVLVAYQPDDSGLYYDEGSPGGRLAGAMLIGGGAAFGVVWLAVSALLWRPKPPRPTHANPLIDRL